MKSVDTMPRIARILSCGAVDWSLVVATKRTANDFESVAGDSSSESFGDDTLPKSSGGDPLTESSGRCALPFFSKGDIVAVFFKQDSFSASSKGVPLSLSILKQRLAFRQMNQDKLEVFLSSGTKNSHNKDQDRI